MADRPMGDAYCPVCEYEWHEDDYCELNEGSEIECPKCGAQLAVSCVQQVWEWSVSTKEVYEETVRQDAESTAKALAYANAVIARCRGKGKVTT